LPPIPSLFPAPDDTHHQTHSLTPTTAPRPCPRPRHTDIAYTGLHTRQTELITDLCRDQSRHRAVRGGGCRRVSIKLTTYLHDAADDAKAAARSRPDSTMHVMQGETRGTFWQTSRTMLHTRLPACLSARHSQIMSRTEQPVTLAVYGDHSYPRRAFVTCLGRRTVARSGMFHGILAPCDGAIA
jgi:hypothetical protein